MDQGSMPPYDATVEPTAASQDLGMRTAGFLLTVLGALVAGIGSMLDWVTVTIPDFPAELAPTIRGVDATEGKLVLAAAVVATIAVLVTRIGATASARRGAAVVVLVAGTAIVAIAAREALTAEDRYVTQGVEEVRDVAASLGAAEDDVDAMIDDLASVFVVEVGTGVWLALAGGLVTVAGGAVTLVWASRRARAAEGPAPPPAGFAGATPPRVDDPR
jgi:hypothetical protein